MKSAILLAASLTAVAHVPSALAGKYADLDMLIEPNPIDSKYERASLDLLIEEGILLERNIERGRRLGKHRHHHVQHVEDEYGQQKAEHPLPQKRDFSHPEKHNYRQEAYDKQHNHPHWNRPQGEQGGGQEYQTSSSHRAHNNENYDNVGAYDPFTSGIADEQTGYWDDDNVVTDDWTDDTVVEDDWVDDDGVVGDGYDQGWDTVDEYESDSTTRDEGGDAASDANGDGENGVDEGDDGDVTIVIGEEDVEMGREGDEGDDANSVAPTPTPTFGASEEEGEEGDGESGEDDDDDEIELFTRIVFSGFFHKAMSSTVVLNPFGSIDQCDGSSDPRTAPPDVTFPPTETMPPVETPFPSTTLSPDPTPPPSVTMIPEASLVPSATIAPSIIEEFNDPGRARMLSGENREPGTTFVFQDAPLEDLTMLMFGPLMGLVQGACKRIDCFGKAYCQFVLELMNDEGFVVLSFNAEGPVENGKNALTVTGGQTLLLGVTGQILVTPGNYAGDDNSPTIETTEDPNVDFMEGTDGYVLDIELLVDPRYVNLIINGDGGDDDDDDEMTAE